MKILFMFALAVSFVGCGPVKPALSVSDQSSLESYPVKGRQGLLINQKLSFGTYETSRVKRSWTKGRDFTDNFPSPASVDYVNREQRFQFQMKDSTGNFSEVYASSEFNSRDLRIGDNPNSIVNILQDIFGKTDYSENLFYFQLYLNEDSFPWQMVLDNQAALFADEDYTGILAYDRNKYFIIKPITRIEGKNGNTHPFMGSAGYEIFDSTNRFLAAVSLIDSGNVYFQTQDPKERFILANLFAALLLQQEIAE